MGGYQVIYSKRMPTLMTNGCAVWPLCSGEELPMLICSGCKMKVHADCYSVEPTNDFLCDVCKKNEFVTCMFCPNREGALKLTDSGEWVHIICSLLLEDCMVLDQSGIKVKPTIAPNKIPHSCQICLRNGKKEEAKMGTNRKCNYIECEQWFHVTCAQERGNLMLDTATYDFIAYCMDHRDRFYPSNNERELKKPRIQERKKPHHQPQTPIDNKPSTRASLQAILSYPHTHLSTHKIEHPITMDGFPFLLSPLQDILDSSKHFKDQIKNLEADYKRLKGELDKAQLKMQEEEVRETESRDVNTSLSKAIGLIYSVICPTVPLSLSTIEEEERFTSCMIEALSNYQGPSDPVSKEEFLRVIMTHS